MRSSWRPNSGWDIEHSDEDLAKIGLTVALEAQAHHTIWMIAKPIAQLDLSTWKKWEQRQTKQIVESLITRAEDSTLLELLADFETRRAEAQTLRHQVAHVMWGRSSDFGPVVGRDVRRAQTISGEHIERALEAVAELSRTGKVCALRTADLILDGHLNGGTREDGSPAIRWRDQWVWL